MRGNCGHLPTGGPFIPQNDFLVVVVMISVLQMRKWRVTEVRNLSKETELMGTFPPHTYCLPPADGASEGAAEGNWDVVGKVDNFDLGER